MNSYRVFVRRVLDRARHLTPTRARIARLALAGGIVATSLVSALGPAAPVRADDPVDPAARLQIVLRKIIIADNGDWVGSSNLVLTVSICSVSGPPACRPDDGMGMSTEFSADTGDQVDLNWVVPRAGDPI